MLTTEKEIQGTIMQALAAKGFRVDVESEMVPPCLRVYKANVEEPKTYLLTLSEEA